MQGCTSGEAVFNGLLVVVPTCLSELALCECITRQPPFSCVALLFPTLANSHLFSSVDQTLLRGRDAFLCFNLCLDVLDLFHVKYALAACPAQKR